MHNMMKAKSQKQESLGKDWVNNMRYTYNNVPDNVTNYLVSN